MPSGGGLALGDCIWGDGVESLHVVAPPETPGVAPAGRAPHGDTPSVVRVYTPSPLFGGGPRAAIELRLVADAALLQRDVASSSSLWAAVESVQIVGGRVVVRRSHARYTAQTLIDRGVRIDATTLRALVEKILRCVEAFHGRAKRAVGILTPRQVLLDRIDDLPDARVTLTDPAPMAAGDLVQTDLRAVARLIEQIVERRPAWAASRWPLPMTDAWKRLGRTGEAWLNAVNRWLDPGAGREAISIDDAIASLPVEPPSMKRPLMAGAGLAAAIGAAVAVYFAFFYVPTVSDIARLRVDLEQLSAAHDAWFDEFDRLLLSEQRRGGDPFRNYRGIPSMAPMLDELTSVLSATASSAREERVHFDPRRFFVPKLRNDEPERSKAPPDPLIPGIGIETIVDTQERFRDYLNEPDFPLDWFAEGDYARIKAALRIQSQLKGSLRESQLAASCRELANRLRSAGLDRPADELTGMLDLLPDENAVNDDPASGPAEVINQPPTVRREPERLASTLLRLLETRRGQESTVVLLETLRRLGEMSATHPSPAPGRFNDWATTRIGQSASLAALAEEAAALLPVADRLEAVSRHESDGLRWDLLMADHPWNDAQPLSAELFGSWIVTAEQYRVIAPDPRRSPGEAAQALPTIDSLMKEVTEFLHGRRMNEADEIASRRQAIDEQLAALRARPLIELHRDQIMDMDRQLTLELASLLNDARAVHRTVLQPPAEFLERMRARRFASRSAQRAWDDHLARAQAATTYEQDRSAYLAFNGRTLDLETALNELIQDRLKLEPEVRDHLASTPLPVRARAIAEERQEASRAAVVEALSRLTMSTDAPISLSHPDVSAALEGEEQAFAAWQQSTVALIDDLARIRRMLDLAYMLEEPDESGATIRALLAARSAPGDGRTPGLDLFSEVFESELTRVRDLEAVADLSTMREVADFGAEAPHSQRVEMARAVWERLGSLPIAGDADSLRVHQEALERYVELVDRLPEPPRASRLRERIDREAPDRWLRHLETRISAGEIEAMLDRMPAFRVAIESMPGWVKWNLDLKQFRDDLRAGGIDRTDDLVSPAIRRFRESINRLEPSLQAAPQVSAFAKELDDMLAPENRKISFSELGPVASPEPRIAQGWQIEPEGPRGVKSLPEWVHYRTTGQRPLHLVFRLIDPSQHPDLLDRGFKTPVYISTTEVSFSHFYEAIGRERGLPDVLAHLADRGQEDDRGGPRVWQYRANPPGLVLPLRQAGDEPQAAWRADTANWRVAGKRVDYDTSIDESVPNRMHPMQHISPTAALYSASLLGCRLPTSLEFQAALREQLKGKPVEDWSRLKGEIQRRTVSPPPNLRDVRFERLRAHLATVVEQLPDRLTLITPDYGSFNCVVRTYSDDAHEHLTGYDDGVLYFSVIPSDPVFEFQNLLGNVMEWTYDDPEIVGPPRHRRVVSPDEARKDIRPELLGVMGGSSMSPPSLDPLVRQPVNLGNFAGRIERVRLADVGFRLAFEAPGRPLAEWALETSTAAFDTPARRTAGHP